MKLAHVVPSLEERHGGPSRSVRTLANTMAGFGDEVDLLATQEAGQPVANPGTDTATVSNFPRVAPLWLSRSPELSRALTDRRYEVIHHHSLWLLTLRYAHDAAKRSGVPLVISPRGMMSGWAYEHRRWRKRIAELLIHPGAFADAAGWHATSPEEADDIRRLGFTQPICVSPNGVVAPSDSDLSTAREVWQKLCPAVRSRPVALFYSRFHRKKRLRELIDLWLASSRGDWLLLIAGVPEDYSLEELNAVVTARGAQEKIALFNGADLPPPYAVASLFILPSHSENFGLVIAEALAARVPALVTDATPWQGLNREGCGWCVPWDNFGATLNTALVLPAGELQGKGQHGRSWVGREFSWDKAARLLKEFYTHLRDEQA